jgi:hypothetical protein
MFSDIKGANKRFCAEWTAVSEFNCLKDSSYTNFWFLGPNVLSKCMGFVEQINRLYVVICFVDQISFFRLFLYNHCSYYQYKN